MKLLTDDVKLGKLNGQKVWICDYRYNDFDNKPIRHIPPTQCIILDKKDCKKKVYYSESFFAKLKRNGEASKTQIQLFDNTGYRSFEGVALNVFSEEKSCRNFYASQCEGIKKELIEYKTKRMKHFDNLINELGVIQANNSI